MDKKLTYREDSPIKLTDYEEELLYSNLSHDPAWLEEFIQEPIYADDGYDLSITSSNEGTISIVGRSALYEEASLKRLEAENTKDSLRGLYFPSATPSRSLLNLAAFYFDELFIIHPGRSLLGGRHSILDEIDRNRRYRRREYPEEYIERLTQFIKRLVDFNKEVLVLKRESIVHTIPPQMQKHPQFIELLTADLDDPKFEAIVKGETNTPVFIAAEKGEPLWPLIGEELNRRLSWKWKEMSVEAIREELSNRARTGFRFTPDLFHGGRYGVKEVEPVLAASILLNHAFLTAEQYSLIPVTDNQKSKVLLQRKLERISEQTSFVDYKRELDIKTSTLAMRVLEDYLPTFSFESFEQILEARYKLQEQLTMFRQAMASFAAEIDESPYQPQFHRRIEEILASKIRPAVEALKTEIQKSRDAFIVRFLKNAQTGSIPIVALMFAGLPASAVIAVSAGIMTMEAAITTYREIKRTRRNGLSLLLG
jgi:hypothetical protein